MTYRSDTRAIGGTPELEENITILELQQSHETSLNRVLADYNRELRAVERLEKQYNAVLEVQRIERRTYSKFTRWERFAVTAILITVNILVWRFYGP